MNDDVKKAIEQMKEDIIQGLNFHVPLHRHTGIDAPQIEAQYLKITPEIGIPFRNGSEVYSIYSTTDPSRFVFTANNELFTNDMAQLFIGDMDPFLGNPFNRIYINGSTTDFFGDCITITSNIVDPLGIDPNNVTSVTLNSFFTVSVTNGVVGFNTTFLITDELASFSASDAFALRLPDAILPSALEGMVAFNGGNFQASEASGTWKYIPTSTGSTGGGTVASGTVSVTIGGVNYNLLHT